MTLVNEIKALQRSSIRLKVEQRLKEFASFKDKPDSAWFSELCFCLLTANSKARTALAIQAELGENGFAKASASAVRQCIIDNKHRFHNNKTAFIVAARRYPHIKKLMQDIIANEGEFAARFWLVKNIKGLGFKEASHFLRNVGCQNLSILDRHILNLMVADGILKSKPDSLTPKRYLEIEQDFFVLSKKLQMVPAELDLYMWFMKAGEVLK